MNSVETASTKRDVVEEQPVREWDVAHGPRKEGMLERMTMALPAMTRVVTNIFGGAAFGTSYAVGKVGEKLGRKKAVDSSAFRYGARSWLLSNGIVPKIVYEPLGEAGLMAAKTWGGLEAPAPEDMRQAPMIVCNHTSYLDGAILAAFLGFPRVVAKAGVRKAPFIGKIMEEMECVFLDREEGGSRKAALEAISNHCSEWRPGSRSMMIFPEGTTSNGEGIIPFKRGAFASGLPVRPVLLVYTGQWDPAATTFKETDHGLEKTSDKEWFSQFAGHWVHSVHVRVLAPYVPSQEEMHNAELYSQNCQAHMSAALERVRKEVHDSSWKAAAGRTGGGLGYKFGDISRAAVQSARGGLPHLCCGSRACADTVHEPEEVLAAGSSEPMPAPRSA